MKITIKSTSMMVRINGMECRVWEGTTERGVPMHAYIVRVAVDNQANASEFEQDLRETVPPSPAVDDLPPAMVILDRAMEILDQKLGRKLKGE